MFEKVHEILNKISENKKFISNYTEKLKQISKGEIIAIIGSGISGLICALTLANRGYTIHLYEQKNELNPMGKICTIFGEQFSSP